MHMLGTSGHMREKDIYEIVWLGEAKNNCNLIESGGFSRKTELMRHGQGDLIGTAKMKT